MLVTFLIILTLLIFDYIDMDFTVNNGKINQHTRVCRQKLGNFLIFCLPTHVCRQKFLWIF
jgi:hypothetical protein